MLCLGVGLQTTPYQLGAFAPALGDTHVQCILPEGAIELAENFTRLPLVRIGGRYTVHNRHTQQLEPCTGLEAALQAFLTFLETMKQRVRPAYDGVVLVSYTKEATPVLLQRLEQHGLLQRFWRTVASLGDLAQYIKEVHAEGPMFQSYVNTHGLLDLMPLDQAYVCAFKRKGNLEGLFMDLRANYVYQILLQLHQKEPTYANFYRVS